MRQDKQNAVGWCFPSAKAASTQKGFPRPTRFCQNPARVVLPQDKSDHHPKRFSPSRRDFAKTPHGWCFPSVKAAATTAPLPPSRTSRPTLTRVHHSTPTGVRHSTPIRVSHSTPTRMSHLTQHNATKNRSGVLGQRPKPCWERVRVWERENPASEVEGYKASHK